MNGITTPFVSLLLVDTLFVAVVLALLMPWAKAKHAGWAVLRRNFVGYFSNPTGYLFILMFVAACSLCAFFPHDFFNNNLATLHQLNSRFSWVMLVYVATITMGIWSEERRQGTDELLLTVPASDWDIVLGKYLAAVAIYSVSLLFSQLANFLVLAFLSEGSIDVGLFATTYLGYWLLGLAMLALGMVGSFLTRNLTIGFILGVLFNLPLVLSSQADGLMSSDWARTLARFSFDEQFLDFGRGVISGRSVIFFLSIIAIGLYLSVVLVGRRHWVGGRDGKSMLGHFLVRALSLLVLSASLTAFFAYRDPIRVDGTSAKVNSLSANTLGQLEQLRATLSKENARAVKVEAFISQQLPEDYARVKVDLLGKLRELEAKSGNRILLNVFQNLDAYSEEATRAREQYGIQPQTVMVRERGAIRQEDIFMGVAFTSGLEEVVVPFFDQGIPVEYELLRSICTVTDSKRKRLGVVNTDAQLFGGFDMQRMTQIPKQLIVEELEKQYEVVRIDPNAPIQEKLDVLLVVQPSSLGQQQMENLVAFVRGGTPTAIFEDPMPVMMGVPGTSQPKAPAGGMMGMGAPPEPKGDIRLLWNQLGIGVVGAEQMGTFNADVVWQDYNPYKKAMGFREITKEWVFASPEAPGAETALNPADAIVSGLQQILLLYPGGIVDQKSPGVEVTPLVSTGSSAGTIGYQDLVSGGRDPMSREFKRQPSPQPLTLAVRIRTKGTPGTAGPASAPAAAPASPATPPATKSSSLQGALESVTRPVSTEIAQALPPGLPGPPADSAPVDPTALGATAAATPANLNVIYVTDVDMMHSEFLRVRAQPNMSDIEWKFDNVTFVLNVIDDLASDNRFLDVRKKQTRHSTLKLVESQTSAAREAAEAEILGFEKEFKTAEDAAKAKQKETLAELQKKVDDLTQQAESSGTQPTGREIQRALQSALQQMGAKQEVEQRRLDSMVERLTKERDKKLQKIERELDSDVQKVQNSYKGMALFLPMLPPLVVGLLVFLRRRSLESEGVTADRRR
jgi:ABC-2 type transport system permease protein